MKTMKIYAACDAFLMPSRFEPCGLSQLISMKYGCLPIVRETGGLSDTVIPYNEFTGEGTGFSFMPYNADDMMTVVNYAMRTYYDNPEAWTKLVKNAMSQDFSWNVSADKYIALYEEISGVTLEKPVKKATRKAPVKKKTDDANPEKKAPAKKTVKKAETEKVEPAKKTVKKAEKAEVEVKAKAPEKVKAEKKAVTPKKTTAKKATTKKA